ncbi:MAG: DUF1592 domain-containing protein, partial [Planctomycetota bacterium]|nr:DUF1592 domain-containing protein [Planctomycetota bacterium]
LDGQNDSVVVQRHPAMDVRDGDFTVAAWIRPTQLRQAGIVCLGKYSWTHGWYFDMPNNQGVLRLETANPNNQPNGTVQSAPGTIRVNQWQHVAAVVRRGENQTTLYVNGYEVAKGTIAATQLDNPNVDLYIGRIQDSKLFQGQIDDVQLFRRALDRTELRALLDKGNEFLQPPPPAKPTQLDMVIQDERYGRRQLTGTLHQPAFAYVRLAEGKLDLETISGKNQPVKRVTLVRVPKTSTAAKKYTDFENRCPKLGVHLGLRRDCGSTLARVGHPVDVRSAEFKEFVFQGAIQNFPNPDVEANNVNYLAGIREIGVRSEYTDGRDRPQLMIRSIEFEGPYYDSWPPPTHQALLIEPSEPKNLTATAQKIIGDFATRAFRRPLSESELPELMKVFEDSYSTSNDFSQSIKDTLLVVLTSPPFLFLLEESRTPKPEPLTDYEMASKLSFFLWDSPPDQQTLELAKKGGLRNSLEQEVARMVANPKFNNFCQEFCRQWLELDRLEVVEVDRKRFPRLDRDTKTELGKEPAEFLRHLVQHNLPAENLIDSQFVMANEVTASYYQLQPLPENGFNFTAIPTENPALGGLLSQAGILAGLSDGRESNPIKRGAWLARKIIAEPPEDPPPNVPQLATETRQLPLRERLAAHRNQKGCLKCHSGIDPWGLPLEDFDAGGQFQSKNNVNSRSVLPDKTEINGFLALKKYLAQDRIDQVAFCFTKQVATYAIGRSLTYNEIETVKRKCVKLKAQNYRLQDILLTVVNSSFFLEK